jgi:hypothetical protein
MSPCTLVHGYQFFKHGASIFRLESQFEEMADCVKDGTKKRVMEDKSGQSEQ